MPAGRVDTIAFVPDAERIEPDFSPDAARNRYADLVDGKQQVICFEGKAAAGNCQGGSGSRQCLTPSFGHRPTFAVRAIEHDVEGAVI